MTYKEEKVKEGLTFLFLFFFGDYSLELVYHSQKKAYKTNLGEIHYYVLNCLCIF